MKSELIHFCRDETFKRIFGDPVKELNSIVDDALDLKAEKATERLQEAREEKIKGLMNDYLIEAGSELEIALSDFTHRIDKKALAAFLQDGDLLCIGGLFATALWAELREIAEENNE